MKEDYIVWGLILGIFIGIVFKDSTSQMLSAIFFAWCQIKKEGK